MSFLNGRSNFHPISNYLLSFYYNSSTGFRSKRNKPKSVSLHERSSKRDESNGINDYLIEIHENQEWKINQLPCLSQPDLINSKIQRLPAKCCRSEAHLECP